MKKNFIFLLLTCSAYLFGHVESITSEAQFQSTISRGVTLVDFYTTWCGPCKRLSPTLERLSEELKGSVTFAKVDADQLSIGKKLGVNAFPTVILFKDGKEMKRFAGNQDIGYIKNFILH